MLRQRNVRSDEVEGEGIFIGDVEPEKFSKYKSNGQSEGGCWKYFAVVITFVTVLSICLNVYQHLQIGGHLRDMQDLNDTHHSLVSEWKTDRLSVEECRTEMHSMESKMNNRETEKITLEKEVTRMRRAIQNGGVTEHPEHEDHHEGDTPPTPHPEQHYPTPPNHHQLEEQQRQQEEQRQQDEQKIQQEEQQRQQKEQQMQQEEQQRQQEEQQRQQEEQERQLVEQQRLQEEQQRQQEEQQRLFEEQQRQEDEVRKQQVEQQIQQEEHQRQLEDQQKQEQARAENYQHLET